MKISKKILLALFIAVSAGSFAPVSFAEEGRTTFAPGVAIDNVVKKIDEAIAAIDAGKDNDIVAGIIKEVKDLTKEINANDKVDIKNSQARGVVKSAQAEAKNGDLKTAAESLKKAKEDFIAIKKLI